MKTLYTLNTILFTHIDLFMCPAVINSLMLCTSATVHSVHGKWLSAADEDTFSTVVS